MPRVKKVDTEIKKEEENKEKSKEKAPKKQAPALKDFYGLGRRKRAVARVWIKEEKGDLTINGISVGDFYKDEKDKSLWQKPFHVVGVSHPLSRFSGTIKVAGGGKTGQLEAISLGLSRALLSFDSSFRPKLRAEGLLTRDSREVESKKVYLKKARKAPQYSKR